MSTAVTQPKPSKKESLGFWRENIEALTVAILMALLIKQFAFESFAVPTESMEPTIIGRKDGGYRIIVNKFVYQVRDPKRWEVGVFQYPHHRLINYVKRVVGLPGEWVFIRNGDIYTADNTLDREEAKRVATIQRKPDGVQERLFDISNSIPIDERGVDSFSKYWVKLRGDKGQGQVSRDNEGELVRFKSKGSETLVAFTRPTSAQSMHNSYTGNRESIPILSNRRYDDWSPKTPMPGGFSKFLGAPAPATGNGPPPGYDDVMADLRLSFEVKTSAAGYAVIEIADATHNMPIRLVVAAADASSKSMLTIGEEKSEFEARIESDEWVEVSLSHYDDRLVVRVDGDEVFRKDYRHDFIPAVKPILGNSITNPTHMFPYPKGYENELLSKQKTQELKGENALRFGFAQGDAEFRSINLARDLYYNFAGPCDFQIPDSQYLMLGDNSPDSLDGRGWRVAKLTLRGEGDEVIVLEGDAEGVSADESKPTRPMRNPFREDGKLKFTDVYGNTHIIDPDRIIAIDDPRALPEDPAKVAVETRYGNLVDRKYFVGRAYFVFFPLRQIGVIK